MGGWVGGWVGRTLELGGVKGGGHISFSSFLLSSSSHLPPRFFDHWGSLLSSSSHPSSSSCFLLEVLLFLKHFHPGPLPAASSSFFLSSCQLMHETNELMSRWVNAEAGGWVGGWVGGWSKILPPPPPPPPPPIMVCQVRTSFFAFTSTFSRGKASEKEWTTAWSGWVGGWVDESREKGR